MGDLPSVQYNCTCSLLPNGEVLIAGCQTSLGEYTSTADVLSIVFVN